VRKTHLLCAWQVLIEERDEAIQEISQQIGEVHEIFQVRAMPALSSSTQ
jgi:hypothetical protein